MSNSAFNPFRSTREPRDDEHVPPSERYTPPPAALMGPAPSYEHYRSRIYSVLGGPPVSLFVRALEEDRMRAAWAREVETYTGMDTCHHGDHPDSCSTCARFAAMAACYREGTSEYRASKGR